MLFEAYFGPGLIARWTPKPGSLCRRRQVVQLRAACRTDAGQRLEDRGRAARAVSDFADHAWRRQR